MAVVPTGSRSVPATPSVALGLAFLLLYAVTASSIAPATTDGYSELAHGLAGTGARPNHLLLTPLWQALAALGGGAGAFFHAAVWSNVVAGALAVGIWHFVARRHGAAPAIAFVAAGILGVSHGWWSHARDVESAMVAHAFFLAAFLPAALEAPRSAGERVLRGIAAGIAFALAGLFALNLVVFAPAWLLALRRRGSAVERADQRIALVAAATAALLAIPLFLAAHAAEGGSTPFFRWLTSHPTAHLMGAVQPGPSLGGVARAFAGAARFFLPLDGGVPGSLKRLLVGEPALPVTAAAGIEFAVAVGLLLAFTALVLRRLRRPGALLPLDQAALVALVLAVIVNVTWLGSDPQFWLPVFPLAAWMALRPGPDPAASATRPAWPAALAAAVVALVVLNGPWPTPTRSVPAGSDAWRSARAFAAAQAHPTLLLGVETPWSCFAAAGSETIRRRSWLYAPDGHAWRTADELFALVDSALAAGAEVIVEDLAGPEDLRSQGTWENVRIALGRSRSDLARDFASRYSLVDRSPLPRGATGALQQVRPRAGPSPRASSGSTPHGKED